MEVKWGGSAKISNKPTCVGKEEGTKYRNLLQFNWFLIIQLTQTTLFKFLRMHHLLYRTFTHSLQNKDPVYLTKDTKFKWLLLLFMLLATTLVNIQYSQHHTSHQL